MRSKFAPKCGNQGKNGTESNDSVKVQGNPKRTNPTIYSRENGRQPKWKTTKMKDNQMEDDQNGRQF